MSATDVMFATGTDDLKHHVPVWALTWVRAHTVNALATDFNKNPSIEKIINPLSDNWR